MQDFLYLQLKEKVHVDHQRVTISDVATVTCKNTKVLEKVKGIVLYSFEWKKRIVFSHMKIIELIGQQVPEIIVMPLGKEAVIIEYQGNQGKRSKFLKGLKLLFVSLISFFGTAFSIVAFHNDIGIHGVFDQISILVLGEAREMEGVSILEISYAIGLAMGIILFYNRLGHKKITKDATPIEVSMCQYEMEVNQAVQKSFEREREIIDVS